MDGFLPERGNKRQLNVLGEELKPCNFGLDNSVVTGFIEIIVVIQGLMTLVCILYVV